MGSPVPLEPRRRDTGPLFSGVAPEIIEDTLIHLATENEQYLCQLPEQAGCFKETRIVEFIFLLSEKWHLGQSTRYQAVELLERIQWLLASCQTLTPALCAAAGLCYLTRETIYDTLLKIAIENSTPSELQIAKFLTVKEDFMLLAVGVISAGVFILSPGHWEQVVEHLNCITGITPQSILEFSYAVVRRIIGSTTPEQRRGNCGTKSPGDRILPRK
ncbi:hypothetical protein DUI87_21939 [Hirundo rustica rustica]|uniref:Cyclin N-terminal domain-containing protein n=1 Tax=Hirundo rustica rustica TaxID=333673 RepID=A0A3M0JRX4_HIRRU|nr:hypothetical protein DUI87_21939 [Hirundo rustica rustica]